MLCAPANAFKAYVCNVATQPGETDGYTCRDPLRASKPTWAAAITTLCWSMTVAGVVSPTAWTGFVLTITYPTNTPSKLLILMTICFRLAMTPVN